MEISPPPDARRFGYARVSTDDQDLALQLSALAKAGVHGVYEDKASGATMKRPGWAKLRRAIRRGDTIVVWKLDRLGRTVKGVLQEIEELDAEGVEIEVLTENFDTKTAGGRMMRSVMLSFAQMEREMTSERTRAGMEARRAQGAVFGPKHSITSYPERLEVMRPYVESGAVFTIPPDHALAILNGENGTDDKLRARLKRLRKIRSVETFRRWRRDGCAGISRVEKEQKP